MRRVRSNFRPQVNIPKAKKLKKEEPETPTTAGPVQITPDSVVQAEVEVPAATVDVIAPSVPAVPVKVQGESEANSHSIKNVTTAVPAPSASSPPPLEDESSSEDEGVIDPYDPNNPQGTRSDRERGTYRKNQRIQKTYAGGKPTSMIDYLFYNPKTNPMTHSQAKKALPSHSRDEEEEESEDDPDADDEAASQSSQPKFAPTVQLKLGPDGSFQVDEKSLVLETTEARRGREKLGRASISSSINYPISGRSRVARIKWTNIETIFFYKCLATVGTDFEMISKYFPGRTRHHIKLKFKLEEKTHPELVAKALDKSNFDVAELQHDYLIVARKAKEERSSKKPGKKAAGQKFKAGARKGVEEDEEEHGGMSSSDQTDSETEEALQAEMNEDKKPHVLHVKREAKLGPGAMYSSREARPAAVNSPQPTPAEPTPIPNPMIRQILSTGLKTAQPPVMTNFFMRPPEAPKQLTPKSDAHVPSVTRFFVSNTAPSTQLVAPTVPATPATVQTSDCKVKSAMRQPGNEMSSPSGLQFPMVSAKSQELSTEIVHQAISTLATHSDNAEIATGGKIIIYDPAQLKSMLPHQKDAVPHSAALSTMLPDQKDVVLHSAALNTMLPDQKASTCSQSTSVEPPESEEEEEEADLSGDEANSSDSEKMELEFLSKSPLPTRSGRIPKHKPPADELPVAYRSYVRQQGQQTRRPRKQQFVIPPAPNFGFDPPSPTPSDASSTMTDNQEAVQDRGSLLVLKTNDPNDPSKVLFKVFMISPDCGGTTVVHNPDGSVQAVTAATQDPTSTTDILVHPQDTPSTSVAAVEAEEAPPTGSY